MSARTSWCWRLLARWQASYMTRRVINLGRTTLLMYSGWKEMTQKKGLTSEQSQRMFVALISPKLLEPARAILAHILADRSKEHLHAAIYDSMLLDNTIRAGRLRPDGKAKNSLSAEDRERLEESRKVNG